MTGSRSARGSSAEDPLAASTALIPFSSAALVRFQSSIAWELRSARAKGLRVSLVIDGGRRVEGHIASVAPSGAYVLVGDLHVPVDRILAVRRPSRLGDTTFDDGGEEPWTGYIPLAARQMPGQLRLPGLD